MASGTEPMLVMEYMVRPVTFAHFVVFENPRAQNCQLRTNNCFQQLQGVRFIA